jgi:hypothetical protein
MLPFLKHKKGSRPRKPTKCSSSLQSDTHSKKKTQCRTTQRRSMPHYATGLTVEGRPWLIFMVYKKQSSFNFLVPTILNCLLMKWKENEKIPYMCEQRDRL